MAQKREERKAKPIVDCYSFTRVLVELEDKQALSKNNRAWLDSAHIELHRAQVKLSAIRARLNALESYPCVPLRERKADKLLETKDAQLVKPPLARQY